MCGITGKILFDKSKFVESSLLKRMCDTIIHRGPDDEGFFNEGNVGLGMRRLSIIDIDGGQQPIFSRNNTLAIVFNGEIYNYPVLKKELEARGHTFKTNSDTETILKAYEEWGLDFPNKLNGMFAIAIWDKTQQMLSLVRDRLGVKPLYYYQDNEQMVFGSEIKAILADDAVPRRLNFEALNLYLSLMYIPQPLSMIENIHKLPPAHYLTIKNGKTEIKRYWQVDFKPDHSKSIDDFSEEFNVLFEDAVKIRMLSEVPLGAFLSGGIDSSSIVAMMTRNSSMPVRTFSLGFKEGGYHDETQYAEQIACRYNTIHSSLFAGAEMLDMMDTYVQHFDEPFGDYAAFPTYLISKLAKEHITVVLTGDGGDEVFAGYERYKNEKIADTFSLFPKFFRQHIVAGSCAGLKKTFHPDKRTYILLDSIQKRAIEAGMPAERRYIGRFQVFGMQERKALFNTDGICADTFIFLSPYYKGYDGLSSRLHFDINTLLPEDMLTKVDRVTMAVSLEARVPFLDYRIVELAAQIPSHLKLKGLNLKYFLKHAFKNELPQDILHRPKHGFSSPIDKWLRNELKELVFAYLSEHNLSKFHFLNLKFIRSLLEEHVSGKKNHGEKIFLLMVLVVWMGKYQIKFD